MANEYLLATNFIVAAAMAGLATWLLYLDFSNRISRSLALVLGVRAATVIINQVILILPVAEDPYWVGVRGYFILALPFLLVDFFIIYNWRMPYPGRRAARWVVAGVAMMCEAAYLFDHSTLEIRDATGEALYGPLAVLFIGQATMFSLLAIWFAFACARSNAESRAKFNALVSLGFASFAMVEGTVTWLFVVQQGSEWLNKLFPEPPGLTAPLAAAYIVYALALPLGLASVAILFSQARRRGWGGARANWILVIATFCLAMPTLGRILDPSNNSRVFFLLLGLARLVFPALVGYAVIRQTQTRIDPFELDVRVRIGLKRGTIGGIFVAGYFVVSEGATKVIETLAARRLEGAWAEGIGIVGAALLVFVMNPLLRMGDQISGSALPHARPVGDLSSPERSRLYREQAELAWLDGSITVKERMLLDRLRDRLGLPLDEAARLETEAATGGHHLEPMRKRFPAVAPPKGRRS
ncbi:MAG: hypothetical protein HYT80_10830 [Euryarchaeota archaeon]|nr:hypothetical protein [Euryarchaeota archaeon]